MLDKDFDKIFGRKLNHSAQDAPVDPPPFLWSEISHRLDVRDRRRNLAVPLLAAAAIALLGANLWTAAQLHESRRTASEHAPARGLITVFDTVVKRAVVYDTLRQTIYLRTLGAPPPVMHAFMTPLPGTAVVAEPEKETATTENSSPAPELQAANEALQTPALLERSAFESVNPLKEKIYPPKPSPVIIPTAKEAKKPFFFFADPLVGVNYNSGASLVPAGFEIQNLNGYGGHFDAQIAKNIRARLFGRYTRGHLYATHLKGLDHLDFIPQPANQPLYRFRYWEIADFRALSYGLELRYQYPTKRYWDPYFGFGLQGSTFLPHQVEFEYKTDEMPVTYAEFFERYEAMTRFQGLSALAGLDLRLNTRLHVQFELSLLNPLHKKTVFYDKMFNFGVGMNYRLRR